MSERFTEHDRKILSIWKDNCKAQWDNIATAGGYPHRKAAQKAVRRVTKKLGLPPTPSGSATLARRQLQGPRPKEGGRSNASAGRAETVKKGKIVRSSRNGTDSATMRNTRANPTGEPRKGRESGQGLNREGAGARIGEGTGEDTGEEGTGEGVDQRVGQGSDRFVKGRPYNERIDRDYRPRVGELVGDSESSDGGDDDNDDDDDDDSEDEMEM
ncbi:hypothetical protein KC323_g3314 [Hortaea werneckii]|nr:hypothetical protein KC323_g3314 [Hortaea werneckii]